MSAATDRPARVQVIELWTGGDADLLRQSLRMTNESFAEYLGVAVRTVASWRAQPGIIPRPAMPRKPWMRRLSARRTGYGPCSRCWRNAAGGPIGADCPGIPDPHACVPAAPSAAQAIPRQRLPADDIDDLLAHVTVTRIGEDAIQQIGQAAICLAESHTQAPARKLLSQVMPLHQRVRSLLGGRLRLSQQRELYRIESLLLSHACLLLGDLDQNDRAERYGIAGLAFAREAGSDQAVAMTVLAKTFRWQKRLTESMDMARRGFACSPDAPIRVQLASQEANAAALLGDAARARGRPWPEPGGRRSPSRQIPGSRPGRSLSPGERSSRSPWRRSSATQTRCWRLPQQPMPRGRRERRGFRRPGRRYASARG